MCLFAVMVSCTSLKAQEATIELYPGWNWIGYPYTNTLDFATMFTSFTPAAGDYIKSQYGYAEYYEGYGWFGSLTVFLPCKGYMYKSNRTESVAVTLWTPLSQQDVTTAEPTDITFTSAMVGSTVNLGEGNHIYARGMCWGTDPMPNVDGSHTTDATVTGSQTVVLDNLTPSTTYYVRAYVATDHGLFYGEVQSFTTASSSYTINVSSNPTEGGTVTGGGIYEQGQSCTIQATPNPGYTFVNWTKDEEVVSSNASFTFTVTDNASYVANFNSNSYEITVATYPIDAGTVTGGGIYEQGQSCTIQATPNPGYTFVNWTKDEEVVSSNASFTFTVTDNASYVANFNSNSYEITVATYPIDAGTVTGGGTYQQGQSCTVQATANTDYIFSNWTENGSVVSTNATYTFTVGADRILVANFIFIGDDDHTYVDLGLPSGTLWATCNVGANSPEEFGDYFAWGETQPKDTCNWSTYQFYNGVGLTKYTGDDGLTTLLPEDDAATANWGANWRMPTRLEWQELINNTTVTWTQQGGVNGRLFTAQNGNTLFLPATGCFTGSNIYYVGSGGYCWSSSLCMEDPTLTWTFLFATDYYMIYCYGRAYGRSVRPVRRIWN